MKPIYDLAEIKEGNNGLYVTLKKNVVVDGELLAAGSNVNLSKILTLKSGITIEGQEVDAASRLFVQSIEQRERTFVEKGIKSVEEANSTISKTSFIKGILNVYSSNKN